MRKQVKSFILAAFSMLLAVALFFSMQIIANADTSFFAEENWSNNGEGNVFTEDEAILINSAAYNIPVDTAANKVVKIQLNLKDLMPENEGGGKATLVLTPAPSASFPHWDWTTDAGIYIMMQTSTADGNNVKVSIGRHTGGGFNYHQGTNYVAAPGTAFVDLIPVDSFEYDVLVTLEDTSSGTQISVNDTYLATIDVGFAAIFTAGKMYYNFGSWGQVKVTHKGIYAFATADNAAIPQTSVDMSGVVFEDTHLTYNGTEQTLVATGTLPKYIKATYSGNKGTAAGTYGAKVAFESTDLRYTPSVAEKTADLIIDKAELTVTAEDKLINQGSAMPELTCLITGFVNGETESALTQSPVLSCPDFDADVIGEYDITVSGGAADNYSFRYVNGTLSVIAAPTYTLSYNANGATGGSMAEQVVLQGAVVEIKENQFTRDGYFFLGWATDGQATEPEYTDGQEIKVDSDMELFAVWLKDTRSDYIKPDDWTLGGVRNSDNSGITISGEAMYSAGIDTVENNAINFEFVLSGLEVNEYISFVLEGSQITANIDYAAADGLYVKIGRAQADSEEKLDLLVAYKTVAAWTVYVGEGNSPETLKGSLFDYDLTAENLNVLFRSFSEKTELYINDTLIAQMSGINFSTVSEDGKTYYCSKGNYKLVDITHPNQVRYTVTFDAQGGSAVEPIRNLESGAHIGKPVNPTKEDQMFLGWALEPNASEYIDFEKFTVTEDITLYAIWADDTRPEYLKGKNWEVQSGAEPVDDTNGIKIVGEAWYGNAISVYDNNAIQIVLDLSDMKAGESASIAFTNSLGNCHMGFTLYDGIYLQLTPFEESGVNKVAIALSVKIGAGWEVVMGNGGTPGGTTGRTFDIDYTTQNITILLRNNEASTNLEMQVNGESVATRNGYVLASASTKGSVYLATNILNANGGSFTIKSIEHPNILKYRVEFDSLGGDPVDGYFNLEPGTKVEAPVSPEKPGYAFVGWALDAEGNEMFDFDTPIEKNYILYAVWEKTEDVYYTVTFDSLGGESVASIENVLHGSKISDPNVTLTKTGYIFKGWSATNGGTTPFDFANTKIKSDLTLYAIWQPNLYTVRFYDGETEYIMLFQQVSHGNLLSKPDYLMVKDGYTFAGWALDPQGEEKYDFDSFVEGNLVLYATWTEGDPVVAPSETTGDQGCGSALVGSASLLFAAAALTICSVLVLKKNNKGAKV